MVNEKVNLFIYFNIHYYILVILIKISKINYYNKLKYGWILKESIKSIHSKTISLRNFFFERCEK